MSVIRMADEQDRLLLRYEMDLLRKRGFRFEGATEQEKLGVDRWILGVAVVEEKSRKTSGRKKGDHG